MTVLEEIIYILNNDDYLSSLLQPTEDDTRIYPLINEQDYDCVCINLVPQSNKDNIVEEYKLEAHAYSKDIIKANLLISTLSKALITFADALKTNRITDISRISGGGCIFNSDTSNYRITAYFSVTNLI